MGRERPISCAVSLTKLVWPDAQSPHFFTNMIWLGPRGSPSEASHLTVRIALAYAPLSFIAARCFIASLAAARALVGGFVRAAPTEKVEPVAIALAPYKYSCPVNPSPAEQDHRNCRTRSAAGRLRKTGCAYIEFGHTVFLYAADAARLNAGGFDHHCSRRSFLYGQCFRLSSRRGFEKARKEAQSHENERENAPVSGGMNEERSDLGRKAWTPPIRLLQRVHQADRLPCLVK